MMERPGSLTLSTLDSRYVFAQMDEERLSELVKLVGPKLAIRLEGPRAKARPAWYWI